jgi:hypothetical protein
MASLGLNEDCVASLIPEYGVVHLQSAMGDAEQRALWRLCKPRIQSPAGKMSGFSAFAISSGASQRDEVMDRFGESLFALAADKLCQQLSDEECRKERENPLLSRFSSHL